MMSDNMPPTNDYQISNSTFESWQPIVKFYNHRITLIPKTSTWCRYFLPLHSTSLLNHANQNWDQLHQSSYCTLSCSHLCPVIYLNNLPKDVRHFHHKCMTLHVDFIDNKLSQIHSSIDATSPYLHFEIFDSYTLNKDMLYLSHLRSSILSYV